MNLANWQRMPAIVAGGLAILAGAVVTARQPESGDNKSATGITKSQSKQSPNLVPDPTRKEARRAPSLAFGAETGRTRDPRTLAVLAKLEVPIAMSFPNETPLEDILKYIKQATSGKNDSGIPIYVDPLGLQEAEKTMTTPVQIDLEGVPLKRSLQLILKQIGLAYVVDDGILAITSENSIDSSIGPCYPELSPLNLKRARAENGDMTLEELREFAEEVKLRAQIDRQIYESSAPPKPAATVKAEEVEHLIRELKELVTLLKADHARAAKTSSK